MKKEKLIHSLLLRYDDELDKELDEIIKQYPEPIPSKSAVMRAALKLGVKQIKAQQKLASNNTKSNKGS